MLREDKIKDLARQIALMIAEGGAECYELPDEEFAILVEGRIDIFALAEWIYARMG